MAHPLPEVYADHVTAGQHSSRGARELVEVLAFGRVLSPTLVDYSRQHGLTRREAGFLAHLIIEADPDGIVHGFSKTRCAPELGYGPSGRRTIGPHLARLEAASVVQIEPWRGQQPGWLRVVDYAQLVDVSDPARTRAKARGQAESHDLLTARKRAGWPRESARARAGSPDKPPGQDPACSPDPADLPRHDVSSSSSELLEPCIAAELTAQLRDLLPPELQARFDQADLPGLRRLGEALAVRVAAGPNREAVLRDFAGRVRPNTLQPVALLLSQLKHKPEVMPAPPAVRRPHDPALDKARRLAHQAGLVGEDPREWLTAEGVEPDIAARVLAEVGS